MQVLYKVQRGLKDPGDQGLPALDVTKVLRESGPPDAESRAGRRHEVLGGLMNNTWLWESWEEIDQTKLAPILLKMWFIWEEFQAHPKNFLGADDGPAIHSTDFQQRSGLAPDGINSSNLKRPVGWKESFLDRTDR